MATFLGDKTRVAATVMRIVWSQTAIANLVEIRKYVVHHKPEAARRLAERIIASVERLAMHPHLGHAGREPETRELVIGGTPYIIPYRIHDGQLAILAVLHGSQDRMQE